MALIVKNSPANAEDVRDAGPIPGWEGPLGEGMAAHSSILAWRVPWTEDPGLQSIGSQRIRLNWSSLARTHTYFMISFTILRGRNSKGEIIIVSQFKDTKVWILLGLSHILYNNNFINIFPKPNFINSPMVRTVTILLFSSN